MIDELINVFELKTGSKRRDTTSDSQKGKSAMKKDEPASLRTFAWNKYRGKDYRP